MRSASTTAAEVLIGSTSIALEDGETVLEALERAGLDPPSGCRAGTCCKCMLQADDPPADSQRGLRATLR
ncbi:MAG: 2Fe-2S iron-sulfur cluster binding domain-containing protein [Planctomycetota bacterium]